MYATELVYLLKFKKKTQFTKRKRARLAGLVRSHMNGLIPFERKIQQTTESMSLAQKQ